MQSNWLYWEWSLLVLDVDNGIEAGDGIWYLCSISIVSIDHWPVDIQSPACSGGLVCSGGLGLDFA